MLGYELSGRGKEKPREILGLLVIEAGTTL